MTIEIPEIGQYTPAFGTSTPESNQVLSEIQMSHEALVEYFRTYFGQEGENVSLFLLLWGSTRAGLLMSGGDADFLVIHTPTTVSRMYTTAESPLSTRVEGRPIQADHVVSFAQKANVPSLYSDIRDKIMSIAVVSLFVSEAYCGNDDDKAFLRQIQQEVLETLSQRPDAQAFWEGVCGVFQREIVLYNRSDRRKKRTHALQSMSLTQKEWLVLRQGYVFPTLKELAAVYLQ